MTGRAGNRLRDGVVLEDDADQRLPVAVARAGAAPERVYWFTFLWSALM